MDLGHSEEWFDMESDFLISANNKRNEYLLETEKLFVVNREGWFSDFAVHFSDICTRIRELQDNTLLSSISYIDYTMLYTNFLNRRYTTEVFVYNEKSYLDKNQRFVGEYDISFLFVFFDKLWNDLINLKRRYIGLVSARGVTTYMLQALPYFYSYLTNIVRFAIVECVEKIPFTNIARDDSFMIKVGDYTAYTELVYTERKNKDAVKLTEWFGEHLVHKYIFGDYSGLDFSGRVFLYTDFRYARFQNSTLIDTNFEGSSLIGINFHGSVMEGCRLDNCLIPEADFSNAKLKNASFKNAKAKVGLTDKKNWQFVGFLPMSFRGADLTNADFTGANLAGADFTGATLKGAIFTDAILTGAIFDDGIGKIDTKHKINNQ